MACQRFEALAGVDIPQAHRLVATATDQGLAIGTEDGCKDRVGVAYQRFEALAGGDVPRRTVWPAPPLTKVCPSGLKATDKTQLV